MKTSAKLIADRVTRRDRKRVGKTPFDALTRSDAVDLCSLMACSNRDVAGAFLFELHSLHPNHQHQIDFREACETLGVDCHRGAASALARLAYWSWIAGAGWNDREFWAEAESKLRSGWSP